MIGTTGKAGRPRPSTELASSITIPGSLSVGSLATGTYVFNGSDEENPPPTIDSVTITAPTGYIEGETINFVISGHKVYNDGAAAATVFKLYRATGIRQQSESMIYEGTSTTYVLAAGDVGNYLRVEAIPKQTGGANLTGETVQSAYTDIITT